MSEQVVRDTQAVIDAVIGGNIDHLVRALSVLTESDPAKFLCLTRQLIDTVQKTHIPRLGVFGYGPSEFYHADSKVYGSVYTDDNWFSRKAGPSGIGLPIEDVRAVVAKARNNYDETVLKKALELKVVLGDLERLLTGHSYADSKLTSLAHVELFKGQALLVAALNPVGR